MLDLPENIVKAEGSVVAKKMRDSIASYLLRKRAFKKQKTASLHFLGESDKSKCIKQTHLHSLGESDKIKCIKQTHCVLLKLCRKYENTQLYVAHPPTDPKVHGSNYRGPNICR